MPTSRNAAPRASLTWLPKRQCRPSSPRMHELNPLASPRYNRRMVAVLHSAPVTAAPEALAAWLEQAGAAYTHDERTAIADAVAYARTCYGDLCTGDGEPWLDRALGTAAIVAGLKLDAISVLASVLHGAPHCAGFNAELFKARFGVDVAELVVGVARMGAIRATQQGAVNDSDSPA